MRPDVLNSGYPRRVKLLFSLIRAMTGQEVPDAARVNFHRPEFYGSAMKRLTHAAMRGESGWSVGERELMAAYVSGINKSAFCVSTHTATAATALDDATTVARTLDDLDGAPISEPLRATLKMLGKLTRDGAVTADDIRSVLGAGASREQIETALAVCFAFNVINRLAEAFDFARLTPDGYAKGARYLLSRGYR